MAGHEDLANCRIRGIPKQQGRGLGVYAEDEIWHGQELLLANREYPMEGEAAAREKISEVTEDGTEDEKVLGAEATSTRHVMIQADGVCMNLRTHGQMKP